MVTQQDSPISDFERDFGPMWYWDLLPKTSRVWQLQPRIGTVLIRPYSPAGISAGGVYVEKNPKWAKVWCHILAIPQATFDEYPELEPGQLCLYKRYSTECIGYDRPTDPQYVGNQLPIHILHASSLEAIFTEFELGCQF